MRRLPIRSAASACPPTCTEGSAATATPTPNTQTSSDTPAHNGLTPFGKEVGRELNRLGVMVDVSHVSDRTFYDALEVSRAPVIASHSSNRAIANHPRKTCGGDYSAATSSA